MTNTELLKIAQKHLGQGGARFRKFCGLPAGAAWCNAFVDYVANEGGVSSLYFNGKKMTYCPTSMSWCSKNLACVPPYLALPMDIIYFNWEPNGVPNHIGFVRERKNCDEIYTIEGNTSGGIVAQKTRTTKYVCGIYRPHFKGKFDANKPLVVDGQLGYNTIAIMQRWLKVEVDGILGLTTLKTLQRKLGVTADGIWGKGTSRAIQKLIGTKADGYFGENSVKALQTYLNKVVFAPQPTPNPTPTATTQDKIVAWCKKIAADNTWHYVKWSSNKKTHECPICYKHPIGKYHGWNCIGFCFASWRHGGGIKCHCNNSVINDDEWNKLYKASDATALKLAKDLIGVSSIKVIRNKKGVPQSELRPGDICGRYGSKFEHAFVYLGNGKMADCHGSNGKVATDKQISVRKAQVAKVAIRYIGK